MQVHHGGGGGPGGGGARVCGVARPSHSASRRGSRLGATPTGTETGVRKGFLSLPRRGTTGPGSPFRPGARRTRRVHAGTPRGVPGRLPVSHSSRTPSPPPQPPGKHLCFLRGKQRQGHRQGLRVRPRRAPVAERGWALRGRAPWPQPACTSGCVALSHGRARHRAGASCLCPLPRPRGWLGSVLVRLPGHPSRVPPLPGAHPAVGGRENVARRSPAGQATVLTPK